MWECYSSKINAAEETGQDPLEVAKLFNVDNITGPEEGKDPFETIEQWLDLEDRL